MPTYLLLSTPIDLTCILPLTYTLLSPPSPSRSPSIHLALPTDHPTHPSVPNLQVHSLPYTLLKFRRHLSRRRLTIATRFARLQRSVIAPLLPQILALVNAVKPQVIICSDVLALVAACVGERVGGKVVVLNRERFEGGIEAIYGEGCLAVVNGCRRRAAMGKLGMAQIHALFRGEWSSVWMLWGWPEELGGWQTGGIGVGNVTDDRMPGKIWDVCPGVCNYVGERGEKSFCVAMGGRVIERGILEGLMEVGLEKVVMFGKIEKKCGWGGSGEVEEWFKRHVYKSKEKVPFVWLYPLCSAVLCFGEGMEVFAAVQMGVPVVVVGEGIWGEVVERLGIGAKVNGGGKGKGGMDQVAKAVDRVLEEEVLSRAREYGERIRSRGCGKDIVRAVLGDIVQGKLSRVR